MIDADDLSVEKLNELYRKAEDADKELYSEMRSNVLMVSGKHFERTSKKIWNRMVDARVDSQTKIRLVRNHIHKIARTISNEIIAQAPWVKAVPHAESELADQKAAEIANSIFEDAKHRYRLHQKVRDWVDDFVDLGECAMILRFDKDKGDVVAYEQATNDDGDLLYTGVDGEETNLKHTVHRDELGNTLGVTPHEPLSSGVPIYSGDFVFETILPFNLLRDNQCESMQDARWFIIRKMLDLEDAKNLCSNDEDKKKIAEGSESTFKVFDAQSGTYQEQEGKVLLKEIYFRPCKQYPNGWYCFYTQEVKLTEGELPFGIFPICWAGFSKIQTTPRAHSIIRNLRPLQANVNQLASQQVMHQLTVGDDKLILTGGSKIEKGADFPGIRTLKVSGAPPQILEGRTGSQFVDALNAVIQEMYNIADLDYVKEDRNVQLDPNSMLFRSMRHKKKFVLYAETIEQFLIDVFTLYTRMAQKYLPEDRVIRMIGKRETVNVPEFKQAKDLSYTLKAEPASEDLDSMLGKSLQIQNILQYVGKQLTPEQIGLIINEMPFVNGDQIFSELTMDVKNADSDILALDRGEPVPARANENHKYIIKRLNNRMKARDFITLDPNIQALYEQKLSEHQQMEAQELSKLKAMESEMIPTGGGLIGCDIFTEAPNSRGGTKQVRLRLPQEAIMWLTKMMDQQGIAKAQFEEVGQSPAAGIAQQFLDMNHGASSSGGSQLQGHQQQGLQGQGVGNGTGTNATFNPRGFGQQ
jgi:hypothetical protein